MEYLNKISEFTIIAIMCLTVFQDFKSREISIFLPISILAISIFKILITKSLLVNGIAASINLSFLFVLFLCTVIYYKLKKVNKIIDTKIGKGDLVFFPALIFLFAPISFMVYTLLVFIIALIWFFSKRLIVPQSLSSDIPLAGHASLVFIVYQFLTYSLKINFFSDHYFFKILS